jgi:tetratricopeptide (TPR) repeat protein
MSRAPGASLLAVLLFAFSLTLAPTQALAQPQPNPEAEKEAQYMALFQAGLEALSARNLEQSERIWRECIRIYPERPTAYYNLACNHSLANKTDDAVQALREAFQRGFRDLAHMGRDGDLDAIRNSPAYRAAIADFQREIENTVPDALTYTPSRSNFPVVVWIHDQEAQPQEALAALRTQLGDDFGLVVPQGEVDRGAAGRAWGESAEFLISKAARDYLAANRGADARRVYLACDGRFSPLVVSYAVNSPDLFSGVVAAGPILGAVANGTAPATQRAYLVVNGAEADEVTSGSEARDAYASSGAAVVLERYEGASAGALTRDRTLLRRALAWLQGQEVRLPGEGEERPF